MTHTCAHRVWPVLGVSGASGPHCPHWPIKEFGMRLGYRLQFCQPRGIQAEPATTVRPLIGVWAIKHRLRLHRTSMHPGVIFDPLLIARHPSRGLGNGLRQAQVGLPARRAAMREKTGREI